MTADSFDYDRFTASCRILFKNPRLTLRQCNGFLDYIKEVSRYDTLGINECPLELDSKLTLMVTVETVMCVLMPFIFRQYCTKRLVLTKLKKRRRKFNIIYSLRTCRRIVRARRRTSPRRACDSHESHALRPKGRSSRLGCFRKPLIYSSLNYHFLSNISNLRVDGSNSPHFSVLSTFW
uniref:Uncharacterized protein n=1 Tax=Heterorhabditis bacteriophora TaxID=37862 RepID=A0A1I7X164_HETBA